MRGAKVRQLQRSVSVIACLAAALVAGCGEGEKAPATPVPTVRVERVIDGDTVVLTRFGKTRLIGFNTPEKGRCGDDAATRFTRRELEGETVKYELGEEPKDRYNRTLAYLTRGDRMHNLALVEEGYARVHTIPPNDKYADRFEAAEAKAKQKGAGPQGICDRNRRRALGRERARARVRGEARERTAQVAREFRAAQRRARAAARRSKASDQRRAKRQESRYGPGGRRIPTNCSGVRGPIPTPPGDPTNLDGDNDGQICE